MEHRDIKPWPPFIKLSVHYRRHIYHLESTELTTSCKIQRDLDLSVSPMAVRRHLSSSNNPRLLKFKSKPPLTENHKQLRLELARKNMGSREFWRTVVFSNEKKFNLDGADGIHHYRLYLHKKPLILSKRAQGGGSVMIWAVFGYFGQSKVVFVSGSMNSVKYQSLLKNNLLQIGKKIGIGPCISTG